MTDASPTLKSLRSEASVGRLTGEVARVAALTPVQTESLYSLLATYFDGLSRERFAADLAEKEWVILLHERDSDRIRGFSTLMRLESMAGGERVVAYFSGDTIIHADFRGDSELPRVWARHTFALAAQEEGARVYWYLISSGYKTYRYLPVFYRRFWPRPEEPTPPSVKAVLDHLGELKFPGEYDPATGVVRFARATPLRPGEAEITEARRRDAYVAFFEQANPGHARGDELACLTELTHENVTPAGRRMLGLKAVTQP